MYFFLADKLGGILTYLDRFLKFVFHNIPGNILQGKIFKEMLQLKYICSMSGESNLLTLL